MKVIVSVSGRFHGFNLAHQLNRRGHLCQLITSYPKFKAVEFGVEKEKVDSILAKELIMRSWSKMPQFAKKKVDMGFFANNLFDGIATQKLKSGDIFVGWSSASLSAIKKANRLGMISLVERGSSHIEYQHKILYQEYELFGIKPEIEKPHLEKELQEYEEADYVSIPSSYVKRTFLEKGVPEKKLIHVPYGVDLSEFKQVKKKDGVFRVVFAGGMSLRKGVHYLLKGFSELNLPNSELILLGSINDEIKPFFKKYGVKSADESGRGRGEILHLGHKPQKELHKYYSQGSVFALMSIEEGLAMVQPQAMACGLPVICTTNTGGEDIVRNGKDGFVIPIRDVEALKEKLTFLYENSEKREEMSRSAKERVQGGFSWDDYGRKIIAEYKRILRESER